MSLGKKVTHAVSWLAVAQVAQRATTLVVTAILARRLLPADFGLIALTLLSVNFISYFQDMGLSAALVQRADLEHEHLDTAFWVSRRRLDPGAVGRRVITVDLGRLPRVATHNTPRGNDGHAAHQRFGLGISLAVATAARIQ